MTQSHSARPYVPVKGSRRFLRAGSQVLGRSDPQEWAEVTVKVRRKAPLPEPNPDKPIARADLAKTYGADPKDLDAVADALAGYGVTIVSKDPETCAVKVAGPVAAMERAFQVQLFRVKHDDLLYRGRTGEVHVPEALGEIVTGVFGLDSRPMVKRRRPLQLLAAHPLPPAAQRPWFLPQELAAAYQFPDGDGSGQVIGILEFGGHYVPADLQQFLHLAGLSAVVPEVKVVNVQALPPAVRNNPDFIAETMLDIEIAVAVCPKATVAVFFSGWTEQGWLANLDSVLTSPLSPAVLSVSYGLAEGDNIWTQQAIDHVNDALKALANTGMTVCVATGDDGTDDQVPDGAAHVSFPASSPYVLAVGGTSLSRATGDEVVWFEGDGVRRDNGGATGGGVSTMNPRPTWQQGIDISPASPQAVAGRVIPDVAGNAAGNTGYFMVSGGTPQVSGGTSAATPLWAALLSRVIQGGKAVGFLTPRLYGPTPATGGKPLGAVACRDITEGGNASGTAAGYSATAGFDAVTGWGTPKGTALVDGLP